MRIYIVNKSTVLSDSEVLDALPALQRQTYHVREWWRSSVEYITLNNSPPEDAWQIIIADDSDQAGALGYHDLTPGGRPYGYVFAKTDIDYGYSWTITLSHEICEMILDPWISATMQTDNSTFYAVELCDPVEADSLGYSIHVKNHDPVQVSNFITPNWLIPGSKGVFDYRGECTKPLQVLDGGYAYYWQNGQWWSEDHFGQKMTVAEFQAAHPNKTRLAMYARERKEIVG